MMAKSGYSDTPLLKKLGINDKMKVLLLNPPTDYFELLSKDIRGQFCGKKERPDFIHLFVKSEHEFMANMIKLESKILPSTVIWVSWYKKSAKIPTDVTEDTIRNYALQHGLVDIKVCAVSEIWSGLKLVVPLSKRK
jgi:hypothetical protein